MDKSAVVFMKGVYEIAVCFLVRYIGTVKYTVEPLLLQSKFSSILKVNNFDRGIHVDSVFNK